MYQGDRTNKFKTSRAMTLTHKDKEEQSTKTSKFIKFAVKSRLLPLDVSNKERKVFKFRSWNCFIHIGVYIICIAILDYSVEEIGTEQRETVFLDFVFSFLKLTLFQCLVVASESVYLNPIL